MLEPHDGLFGSRARVGQPAPDFLMKTTVAEAVLRRASVPVFFKRVTGEETARRAA
ncbi:MAG TPA: hypothetical protein VGV13_04515 [Methylomirabilota bacterium]|jgi:hypothetical protein|nr:hypothetical protein [Methylomirabilota bacterium]